MPDDSADEVFEELQDIVQQAVLRGFPNPERKGCPGTEVLRELANRPQPTRDAAWEHVTHCSPCYGEFLELRNQVKQLRELGRRRTLRRRALVAALVVLVAGGAIAVYEALHQRGSSSAPYQVASLDLKDRTVVRGATDQNTATQPLVLPASRLDLTILLPIGSEAGRYEVQVFKNVDQPLLNVSGEAVIENGTTVLRARLDLAGQGTGNFLLALRRPPSDWTYYPVTVR
jgi:hypothetical protein